ncbi:TlpA family protein disulfide reductase [Sphingobium phenoxybenzoativorans]|uniref:TlpA family protein disulfide reductase n=1 Tax=Sphingobium phenoxybenzoativorans TaxID=1592790 RepID=A0A975Q1E8_9SPHN|nr:TlpA disulfide reductase family protein [Sphingobium phenoxybenzoativorans]QUT05739.1 TlpA family protein disulfide reductase [Sphingobium phenoxybenzoativorans]
MTYDCTRRAAVIGGLAYMLYAAPLAAASDYDWRPAQLPPGADASFTDRNGRKLSLSTLRGKPVLLNIWATWCAPCVIELPALDRLQRDLKKRLDVVALSVDRSGMPIVRTALRKLSIRHLDAYVDVSGEVVARFKVPSLPATIAISAEGKPLYIRRGRVDWDDPAEREKLRAIFQW